ncbi:MAG: hypothetical protein ACXVAU_14190 [Mucilaginibacter sp.]
MKGAYSTNQHYPEYQPMQLTNVENKKNATKHHSSQKRQNFGSVNSIKIEERSRSFRESYNIKENNINIIAHTHNQINCLPDIERLVHHVAQSDELIFCIKEDASKRKIVQKDPYIINQLNKFSKNKTMENLLLSFPGHKFNPYIGLLLTSYYQLTEKYGNTADLGVIANYLDSLHELKPNKNYDNLTHKINVINELIDNVKSQLASEKFKESVAKHNRKLRQNCDSSDKYIDGLLKKYPKLIAVHLEVFNKFDIYNSPTSDIRNQLLQAKKDLKRFLNNKRSNKLLNHRVGYMWKLDYRPVKGICSNIVLFFDDSILKEYPHIEKDISEYWLKTINKKTAKNQETFMPQHINITTYRDELKRNISKLINLNYYVKIDLGVRTFGKGTNLVFNCVH